MQGTWAAATALPCQHVAYFGPAARASPFCPAARASSVPFAARASSLCLALRAAACSPTEPGCWLVPICLLYTKSLTVLGTSQTCLGCHPRYCAAAAKQARVKFEQILLGHGSFCQTQNTRFSLNLLLIQDTGKTMPCSDFAFLRIGCVKGEILGAGANLVGRAGRIRFDEEALQVPEPLLCCVPLARCTRQRQPQSTRIVDQKHSLQALIRIIACLPSRLSPCGICQHLYMRHCLPATACC